MRLEAALPTVDVRLWSKPGVFSAKLDADFELFRATVIAATCRRVPDARAVKFYYFRGAVRLAERVPITDDASLRAFSSSAPADSAVWVFLPTDSGVSSPDDDPTAAAAAAAPTVTS